MNQAGPLLGRLHLGPAWRRGESLMAAAVQRARCDDWGQGRFRDGLERLLDALRHDRHVRLTAWSDIHGILIDRLVNRLLIRRYQRDNPACLQEPIDRPIFILGLPRSGTTMLHRLLALDGANRFIPYWEAVYPAPFPDEPPGDASARRAAATRRLQRTRDRVPHLAAIHSITAEDPDECLPLLENSFLSTSFVLLAPIGRYLRWLGPAERAESYGFYREQLQILQCRLRRRQWILKAPLHVAGIEALLGAFPDARIVQTHRDPGKSVPSTASLVRAAWNRRRREIDVRGLGRGVLESWTSLMECFLAVRDRAAGVPFFDVLYDRLRRDPIAAVADLYGRLGLEYTPAFEAAMRDWLANNPQGKYGPHRYSLEEFGLDQAAVESRLGGYGRRFGIPAEP
ncbi:MAG: sulfotransferase [Planctomycetota bacterium]|nr:sulfotransferase [Planctomycetota bacterium]